MNQRVKEDDSFTVDVSDPKTNNASVIKLSDGSIKGFKLGLNFEEKVPIPKNAMPGINKTIESPKLNESNIETAIDLIDDINENKRKAERASSKRKAELESKIAQDEAELTNIPNEARFIIAINDNFDTIKKQLKESGLLKINC